MIHQVPAAVFPSVQGLYTYVYLVGTLIGIEDVIYSIGNGGYMAALYVALVRGQTERAYAPPPLPLRLVGSASPVGSAAARHPDRGPGLVPVHRRAVGRLLQVRHRPAGGRLRLHAQLFEIELPFHAA